MSGMIARQPNGKLCRYSTIVDGLTDYNMTDEEYIEYCAEIGREEARDVLQNHLYSYEKIKEKLLDETNPYTNVEDNKIYIKLMETEVEDGKSNVLDKIRAEIIDTLRGLNYCLNIIDEYKAKTYIKDIQILVPPTDKEE